MNRKNQMKVFYFLIELTLLLWVNKRMLYLAYYHYKYQKQQKNLFFLSLTSMSRL